MLNNTDRAEIAESGQDQIEKTRIKKISTIGVTKFGAGKFAQSGREISPGVGISNWIQRTTKTLPSCSGKVVFAGAAWQRFSRPLDPIADPDTWGYLSPALRKLTGAEFGHTNGRNFLYPGFLYLVLAAFGDFRAIGVVQHLLGLAA